MKNKLPFILLITLSFGVFAQEKFNPPATPAKPVTDTLHGVILTDNYRWLEQKTDPEVVKWTRAQHDYGEKFLAATQKTHKGLKEGIANYINLDYEGPLNTVGKRVFQTVKKKGDKQYKIYTILNGKKVLIWDPVQLDTAGKISTTSTR